MGRVALILVGLTACVSSETVECGDGVVCPRGHTCTSIVDNGQARSLCVEPEQLTVCTPTAEGEGCTWGETSVGTCKAGVCIATICGDAIVSGSEDCEAGNQSLTTCDQLVGEFYRSEPLGCTACVYDRIGCRMADAGYCGDGRRDVVGGEYCDGTDLPFNNDSCLTFGYDAGELGCNTGLCTPGFDGCASVGWTFAVPNVDAQDLWGTGPDDIYAVATDGVLLHFDGDAWTQVQHGEGTADFYGVHGTAANDVYVVGTSANGGVMVHFDGTAWTKVPLPNTIGLKAVWVGGTSGLAVGDGGAVLRLANGSWSMIASPTTDTLRAVWGTSPSEIWVGGDIDNSQSGLWKYNGSSFTPQTLPGVAFWNVLAITGLPTGEVYVAGFDAGGLGTAARLVGTSWTRIDLPSCTAAIFDLWASGPTDLYATGWGAMGKSHVLFHHDGQSWTPIESPSATQTTSVWGSGPGDVYIGAPGGITHGDGRVATLLPFEEPEVPNNCSFVLDCSSGPHSVIAGNATDNVYAFGPNTNCHYNGENWAAIGQNPMSYRAAWVSATDEVFVAGATTPVPDNCGIIPRTSTKGILMYGANAGSAYTYPTTTHSIFTDVHGTSASNVYAVGLQAANTCVTASPLVVHYNGSAWTALDEQPTNMTSVQRVWAMSPSEVYVMGFEGHFARYDGDAWEALPDVPTFCPTVMDMAGTASAIYATCLSDYHLYRYTPANGWTLAGTQGFARFGASMTLLPLADDDIFVFGGDISGDGTITHYKGATATPVRHEGPPIFGAWGTANRIFWVDQNGVHSIVRTVPW